MSTDSEVHAATAREPDRVRCFELWPHRSLSRCGRWMLHSAVIVGLATVSFRSGPAMLPIAIPCTLTYLAFAFALSQNNRSARMVERIEISSDKVRVVRDGSATKYREVEFTTGWVKVELIGENEVLRLRESGRSIIVGAFLSPDERCDLAAELRKSLPLQRNPAFPAQASSLTLRQASET